MVFNSLLAKLSRPARRQYQRLRSIMQRAGLKEQTLHLPNGTLKIWVTEKESDSTLVLLQGFGGTATWQRYRQVRTLGRRFRLVLPDLLYFGDSYGALDDYSIEHQVDTLKQAMERLNIARFDLGGLSYGGLVALRYAAEYPHDIGKLIITASPGPVMAGMDMDRALRHLGAESFEDVFLPKDAPGIRRLLQLAWHRPPWAPTFALLDVHRELFAHQRPAQKRLLQHVIERIGNTTDLALAIPHRVLLIWGRHDRLFPVHIGQRLKAHIGDRAVLHVIEDCAHCPNLEQAHEWNLAVTRFLSHQE